MASKKSVQEIPAEKSEISGFGDNVVKIIDSETGRVVCFIGKQKGLHENSEEVLHFPSPVPFALVEAVSEFMDKRKMRKALDKGDYEKVQRYADKKVRDFFAKK